MRDKLWFGIVACTVALLLGWVPGTLMAIFYKFLSGGFISEAPDFLFLRALFGFEIPGLLFHWFLYTLCPAFLQGFIAGGLGVLMTGKVYTGPELPMAGNVAAGLWTGAFLALFGVSMLLAGWRWDYLDSVVQLGGIWMGVRAMIEDIPEPSAART